VHFSRCLNVSRDGEEQKSKGKSFHIHTTATGKGCRTTVEILTMYFQESTQDSFIHPVILFNIN